MSVLNSNNSLATRPVRLTRSTWDSSTGRKIRQDSLPSAGPSSQEVIDLVDDAADLKGLDCDADDVIMGGADDDGYLSYVSEEAIDDASYVYP